MATVIEGTWEEIKEREAELIGRHLRVTITQEKPASRKPNANAKSTVTNDHVRKTSAYGKYAGILSVEDFLRQKQEEIDLEDRPRL